LAAGLTDTLPYLAQDFVAAESFDVVIRDYGPAPVTEALRIATQLGGALDFAAAVNVLTKRMGGGLGGRQEIIPRICVLSPR